MNGNKLMEFKKEDESESKMLFFGKEGETVFLKKFILFFYSFFILLFFYSLKFLNVIFKQIFSNKQKTTFYSIKTLNQNHGEFSRKR